MNRDDAYALMTEYTQNPSLIKHMLAVEAALRAYARKLGQDEERWGIVGLLHDFDYERWPDPPDHPLKGSEILRERGYPDDVIYHRSHSQTAVTETANAERTIQLGGNVHQRVCQIPSQERWISCSGTVARRIRRGEYLFQVATLFRAIK